MILYAVVVQTLALAAIVVFLGALVLLGTLATPGGRRRVADALEDRERHALGWAWAAAAVAMTGSLYFSDVVGLEPCLMCWYQRIAMYPLVLVLGVALARGEGAAWRYALPLPLVGVVISIYHRFVQERPALELVQCGSGPPCSGKYLNVFGFVTIPTMAGSAFLLIIALMAALAVTGRRATAVEARSPEGGVPG